MKIICFLKSLYYSLLCIEYVSGHEYEKKESIGFHK